LKLDNWFCAVYGPPVLLWAGGFSFRSKALERALAMDIMLYVGNLAKSVSENELRNLFSRVGEVTSLRLVNDDASGRSDRYGFVSMSSQNEADDVIRLFNRYLLSEHPLRVGLVRLRRTSTTPRPLIAP
jgi:hypothetical protein